VRGKDSRESHASEWLMSWGYWGIVLGLVAMVADFFVCLSLVYSNTKGSPKAQSGKIDEPREAVTQASAGRRRAA